MSGRTDIEIVPTSRPVGEKPEEDLVVLAEGQRATGHEVIDSVPVPARDGRFPGVGMIWGDGQRATLEASQDVPAHGEAKGAT